MTPEIEKLLSVLDMTEEEQLKFIDGLWGKREIPEACMLKPNMAYKLVMTPHNRRVLADLAFRLRDEVEKDCRPYWFWGSNSMKFVWEKCCDGELPPAHEGYCIAYRWFFHSAQPIHWIIAAEIARSK